MDCVALQCSTVTHAAMLLLPLQARWIGSHPGQELPHGKLMPQRHHHGAYEDAGSVHQHHGGVYACIAFVCLLFFSVLLWILLGRGG